ncbi:hypothetical protein N2152v2_000782 [Parachlorella kessleri]
MRVLEDTLGMTAFEFAETLGEHPCIYTKPITVIKENAEDLADQLGKTAARQLIREVPGALARGAWPDNIEYYQAQNWWSAHEMRQPYITPTEPYLREASGIPGASGLMVGPLLQYILQLCQEHLDLEPHAVLRRHEELHDSPAQDAALRVTFVGQRSLAARMSHKVFRIRRSARSAYIEISEIDTSFTADSDSEWVARLGRMGIDQQEWTTFKRKFLSSADWERVVSAEKEYGMQHIMAGIVEEQVRDAIRKAGGWKPKKGPAAAAAATATAAAAAATAVKVHEQAAAGPAGSSQAAAAAAGSHIICAAPAMEKPHPGLKIVLTGAKVCLTGAYPRTRRDLTELLEKAGAEVQETVGPTTNYLFCGDPTSRFPNHLKTYSWGMIVLAYDDLLA